MLDKIRLTSDEMRYITLLDSVTGASASDCVIDSKRDRIIFIVKSGDVGLAVGKHGSRIKLMKRMLGRDIEVVEKAENAIDLIKNSFAPAQIKDVRITERLDGKRVAVVRVEKSDKGVAIGKDGRTAERTRFLAKRYFDIDNVVVT